jgi:hypothetical protein
MSTRYNLQSLRKHGVTVREVDEVLSHLATRILDLPSGRDGNHRAMFIGFTANGRLLEVGVEDGSEDMDYVFHAAEATRSYRDQYWGIVMSETKKASRTRQEWVEGIQQDARRRVINRGILHFRLSPDLMEMLLEVAEYKQVGAGILARMWVVEHLREEAARLHGQLPSVSANSAFHQVLAEPQAAYKPRTQQPRKRSTRGKSVPQSCE